MKYEKLEDKKYKVFINRGYGSSGGNMMEFVQELINPEEKENWIIFERKGGVFHIVDNNLTYKEQNDHDWITKNTELGFSDWSEIVENLDTTSENYEYFEISDRVKSNGIVLSFDHPINAENIDELCNALENVAICAWCGGDI